MTIRNLAQRVKRLETRLKPAFEPFEIKINFINGAKEVVSTKIIRVDPYHRR